MPHERKRLLENRVLNTMKHSPIVGILGQRQVGKTTLLESLVPKENYISLDKAIHLNSARMSPETFLDRDLKVLGIDECQLAPELFPALKERIRVNKKPGQFILTGSIRFTSRDIIRESLTGRIVSHELLPLCLSELHQFKLGNIFDFLHKSVPALEKIVHQRQKHLTEAMLREYLQKGGLPGICFFREKSVRDERFSAHLDTLLQRDIKLVFETTLPIEKLLRALRFIAKNQGRAFPFSELSRESKISLPSLQRLIPALEALFLIRRVPTLGDRKKDRFFLEDQGMASFLFQNVDLDFDLLRISFSQFLAQLKNFYGSHGILESFETRSGVVVPLVMDINGEKVGLIPIASEIPDTKTIAAAESFLRHYPKAFVGILTLGRDVALLGKRILAIPIRAVF